ncbi:MAG: type II secretion system F family protein [Planctomycetes bacterium]|nr:type II secretion system F family protein [Planctomycetota bacterium]
MPPKTSAAAGTAGNSSGTTRIRVSDKTLTQFTSNLAVLQDAGLPIVRSLKILEGQTKVGPFKKVLTALYEDVESGNSLSEAMTKHPGVFDPLYANMVKAGEAGGILDTILLRLSEFKEKSQRLKSKVQGAMVYPIVVTIVAAGLLTFITVFVIPKFRTVFASIPGPGGKPLELPALTRFVLGFAEWMLPGKRFMLTDEGGRGWGIVWIPAVLLTVWFGCKAYNKTPAGRQFFDRLKLRSPLVGPVTRLNLVARFARTLGTLLSSGVPILDALNIVRGAIDNVILQDAIQKVHDAIKEGENMAEPLGKSGIFDDMVVNMIDVGEETGELDKMLIRIADNYDQQVDIRLQALVSILEPTLIVLMGVAVGTIVFAIFMPMLQLVQSLA